MPSPTSAPNPASRPTASLSSSAKWSRSAATRSSKPATGPTALNNGLADYTAVAPPPTFSASSNGTVLFTNNICQLEARVDRQRSITSVTIISTDNLIFSNNQLWFDSATIGAFFDALLAAG